MKSKIAYKIIIVVSIFFLLSINLFFLTTKTNAQIKSEDTDKQLLKKASTSLIILKRALKQDGFSSAMGALNIWRSNAKDAGIFDEKMYNDFKTKIYQKSVNNILNWFEICMKEGWVDEANFCCKIYQFKSNAIEAFDQTRYDGMKKRIEELKKKKLEELKKKKKKKRK